MFPRYSAFLPATGMCLAILLGGCSPTYNWREVALEDGSRALFPCKPELHNRTVEIAGQKRRMSVRGCEAGGLSWGWSSVEVLAADARATQAVQQALRDALATNLGGNLVVAGASAPGAASGAAWQIQGVRPDGVALQVRGQSKAGAGWVHQASVQMPAGRDPAQLDADRAQALEAFFEPLR